MSPLAHHQLIAELQANIHDTLAPLVPASGKIVLLDFPDHSNVGDSAIWRGEIEYFHKFHGIRPAYTCTCRNICWEALDKTDGVIFLHGGGNFGDIWPAHQEFREQVLERFPNRKIVQLPQSVHFSRPDTLKRAAELINSHPDFTLLVRDHQSAATAREFFNCRVELCPDMAFCLGPLSRLMHPTHKLLLLMRTDKERVEMSEAFNLPPQSFMVDWLEDEPDLKSKVQQQIVRQLFPELGLNAFNKHRRCELYYRRLAEARIRRGLRLLSGAQFVITDRLHVHILSVLLGIPHITLDNSYKKLGNFIDAWTKECGLLRIRHSLADALNALQEYAV